MKKKPAIYHNVLSQKIAEERDLFNYNYSSPGTIPGTLTIEPDAKPVDINLIDYNHLNASPVLNLTPEACGQYLDTESVSWFDIAGLGNEVKWLALADIFGLHPLLLEDIVNVPQRSKFEDYDKQILVITQMVIPKTNKKGFWIEQVSFVLGKNYLLTVQEESERDCFENVRDRLTKNQGIIRQRGADYLFYSLWDAIIDGYYPVLEVCEDRIEEIEEKVLNNPDRSILNQIYRIKRQLLALRRALWPQRNALNTIIRDGHPLISSDVQIYLRDCYDHIVEIIDMIEIYRELVASLLEMYVSAMGNKMNEIMKILTVISAIFIPLTFIAGVYGMNFENMPELKWYYGYFICLACMLGIAIALIYSFWRNGWFKNISNLEVK
ncbi:magnesium/cobalt transporter CorA [Gloeocapsa sp. PCC 73106]|uniref:magnesium/cobalt transporter CorA n=1 Tax=Gloeocapsa sp. PCC 73106 TaxID=102232 RepID=UPI0002ACED4B|nr:magnesium/cobalt transporter CorA [Gloeocapsa sp. PCC 73106]ELR97170.1 magnesium Mg(2+) and cobalt Co(2+) transport protein CorA [Gloeocapsa sp. PCC 73106]